jgi:retinol dehydrogenase 12
MLDALQGILSGLSSLLFVSLAVPDTSFADQTVIITGSNTGLGLEAARHITRLGAQRVVLAVRSTEKGEGAKTSIEQSTGRAGVVEVWPLDLSSYDSVIKFAQRVNKDLGRLDCLISNAGVVVSSYSKAEDNELSVTVNVVSTFMLAVLLLPVIRKTATACSVQPRMSFLVSDLYVFTTLSEREAPNIFERVNSKTNSSAIRTRYIITKMMDVLLAREFSERVGSSKGSSKIIVNYVNPGFCQSDLGRNQHGVAGKIDATLRKLLARRTEVGSRTLVHGAAGTEETSGQYLNDCRVAQ